MTYAPATSTIFHKPWSPSQAWRYRTCPRMWSYGRLIPTKAAPPDLNQIRGMVLHDCMATAFRAAQAEGRNAPLRYPTGGTMYRHYPAARVALGKAWGRYGMPASSAEANRCLEMITRTLRLYPLPRPGEVLAVEQSYTIVTGGGLPVTFKPDLVLCPTTESGRPGTMLDIVDWKSGDISKMGAVGDNDQLLIYAGLLGKQMPGITAVRIRLQSLRTMAVSVANVDVDKSAARILALEDTAVTAERDDVAAPRPGEHCDRCPFAGLCPDARPSVTVAAAVAAAVTARRAARCGEQGR